MSIKYFGQEKNVKINNYNFHFKIINNENSSEKILKISRDNKPVITHILHKDDGDCSSIQIELGTYEIQSDHIIFYTYWAAADLQGILIYPFGFRKQIYDIKKNGNLELSTATIYIEEDYINDKKQEGLKFLNIKPKDRSEEQLLQNYFKIVAKKYHSKFVIGKEKDLLISEVREKLKQKILSETKDWKETYGGKSKM